MRVPRALRCTAAHCGNATKIPTGAPSHAAADTATARSLRPLLAAAHII